MTTDTQHTDDPFFVSEADPALVVDSSDRTIAVSCSFAVGTEMSLANAQRIVAALNACAGVPTDQLTHGLLLLLHDSCDVVLDASPGDVL